jgi:DnaJ-domain-containing protein 1
MYDSSQKIPTVRLEVEIELDDGETLTGSIWLKPQGRLSDMLNDERAFIPFETTGGKFMMLKKSAFTSVAPVSESVSVYEGNNPFQILGVSDNASPEEIKQAYHRLCAENHPDKLNAAGLSPDYVDMATSRMTRINDAYRRIREQLEQRRDASAA